MASVSDGTLQSQATALIALARELQTTISSAALDVTLNSNTLPSLGEQLNQILLIKHLPDPARHEVDEAATDLWNACSQAMGTFAGNENNMNVLSRVRTLAFGLVEITASASSYDHLRALKAALAAAGSCIDTKELMIGLTVLEAAARRLEALKTPSLPIAQIELNSIVIEYYSHRLRITWLQGRPDIAEHLFFRMPLTSSISNREVAVEVFYSIGCGALSQVRPGLAAKWLERAVEQMQLLSTHQRESSYPENLDLHIRHALVRAYLQTDTYRSREKLKEQMRVLKRDYGHLLAILFLELEVTRKVFKSKIHASFKVLKTIIECIEFTEEKLKLIFSCIKVSKRSSIGLALQAYQSLLPRLPSESRGWFEQSFIRFTVEVKLIASNLQLPSHVCIDVMQETIDAIKEHEIGPLGRGAAHASLIPIWAQIDDAVKNNRFHIAEKWCHLVLHNDIFTNISNSNRRKIQRKLFAIAVWYCDTGSARQILNATIAQTRDKFDPKALFLCYKLELLEEHDIFEYVYPPILAGKQAQNDVECLQQLIDRTQSETDLDENPSVVEKYLFPLFVLSVELLKGKFETRKYEMMAQLLRLAASETQSKPKCNVFTRAELEWMCNRSYQLAHILLKHSRTEQLGQFVDVIHEFVTAHSKDPSAAPVIIRGLASFVPFLRLTFYAAQARTSTDPLCKNEHYKNMFNCINAVKKIGSTNSDRYQLTVNQIISAFELDVTIVRKDWKSFKYVLERMKLGIGFKQTTWVMETLLSFELPMKYRVFGVRFTICMLYERAYRHPELRESFPHYLHVLFDLCISGATPTKPTTLPDPSVQDPPETYLKIAESVIDQALMTAADEAYNVSEEHRTQHALWDVATEEQTGSSCEHYPYPPAELAHLATVSFNQAMDFYMEAQDRHCRRWAKKAIRLAEAMKNDEGQRLAAMFRDRLRNLFRGSC